ncbi:MAG: type I restriction-modification system subunit M N-terminal domain-containing protein [Cyanobacteriota bacterium]
MKERLLAMGLIRKGRGRGGAIALVTDPATTPVSSAPNGRRAKKEAPAKDFKAVLWASADKLRAQMDAAEYKHLVLGLIFLKYISDTFTEHRAKVLAMVSSPDSDFYIGDAPADHEAALEDRDYYTQENVFWVPADARWESLRARAKQPDIGQLIDKALVPIEKALLKRYKYPPDQEVAAIELVLQQTELISEEWARQDLGNQIQAVVADVLSRSIQPPPGPPLS